MPIQTYPESPAQQLRATEAGDGGDARGGRIALALRSPQWWLRASFALLFALYVRTVGFAPVYDDNAISPWHSGWRDIPKFFTHDIFGSNAGAQSAYYRPLPMLWGFLVSHCTGGAPGWLHLAAIFLHLAVVGLAYVFGRHLFRDETLALLTALLFGLHPSKVESTAWIGSSNSDGVAGLLFFATLIAFMKWRAAVKEKSGAGRWWAASAALFAGAMFSKETMLCIPLLLVAYLWLNPPEPQAGECACRSSLLLRSLLPYAVVWTAYMAIRHEVIKPAASSAEYIQPTFTFAGVWTAPLAIWWYLRHLVTPWGLSVEYTPVVVEHPSLRGFVLPAAGLVALLLCAWLLWRRERSALAAFLGFWFAVTLAPAVIFAPLVFQHDRYLNLAAFPFCALVAWAILRMGSLPAKARMAAALCVVALWSGISWHEMGYWDNDTSLWGRAVQISPSDYWARLQLASTYGDLSDMQRALGAVDEGLRYYPNSPNLWLMRAGILSGAKQPEEAKTAYLKVMQATESASGREATAGRRAKTRAAAAYQLALLENKAGDFSQGERYARAALSLRYDGVGYHCALAESLRGEGRNDEARSENALELRLRIEQARQNGLLAHP